MRSAGVFKALEGGFFDSRLCVYWCINIPYVILNLRLTWTLRRICLNIFQHLWVKIAEPVSWNNCKQRRNYLRFMNILNSKNYKTHDKRPRMQCHYFPIFEEKTFQRTHSWTEMKKKWYKYKTIKKGELFREHREWRSQGRNKDRKREMKKEKSLEETKKWN